MDQQTFSAECARPDRDGPAHAGGSLAAHALDADKFDKSRSTTTLLFFSQLNRDARECTQTSWVTAQPTHHAGREQIKMEDEASAGDFVFAVRGLPRLDRLVRHRESRLPQTSLVADRHTCKCQLKSGPEGI
jgi:hypothetical protein